MGVSEGAKVRVELLRAEEATLESQFFTAVSVFGTPTGAPAGDPVDVVGTDVSTLDMGSTYSGVCSKGDVTINGAVLPSMETAVGAYTTTSQPLCQAAESRAGN